jgi:DNA-binding FadR family transcriptional regulator
VVAELQMRILSGELNPGDRLPTENELGQLLGISRSVVRDAVRTLAARGLVEVRQGHGMVVSRPNDHAFGEALVALLMRSDLTMGEVVEAREAIETQLAPLAAVRRTEADLARLHEALSAFEESVEREDWEQAQSHHLSFHVGVLKSIHLPALEIILEPMAEIILVSSLPPNPDDPELWEVPGHRVILDSLRGRDEEGAMRAMREHFRQLERDAYQEMRTTRFRDSAAVHGLLTQLLTDSSQKKRRSAGAIQKEGRARNKRSASVKRDNLEDIPLRRL